MTELTEENLKKYFLGKLSQAENEWFEEEIALSEDLTEQAQIVESELVDDYLRGNLAASDGKLFEAVYLTTEARRERLRLANSLWKIVSEKQKNEITAAKTPNSFWQNWNALRVAFAGFAALLLVGVFAFRWLNYRGNEEIVRQENTNQTTAPKAENQNIQPLENANLINQNANILTNSNLQKNKNASPTPKPKTTPTPKPVAPTLASFTLLPGTLRDEGEQFIKIAPNTTKINLRLNLPKDAAKYQAYTATVKTADGETVFTAPNLKSLNLTLPAAKLENRTHIIFLEGQNAQNPPESIAEYTFRVRR